MTGRGHAGYVVSLVLHLAVAVAVVIIPFEMVARQKSIVLDFSVVKGSGSDNAGDRGGRGPAGAQKQERAPQDRQPRRVGHGETVSRESDYRMTAVAPQDHDLDRKALTGFDPQGQVAVAGDSVGARHTVMPAPDGNGAGTGAAGARTLNYIGSGGPDERNFSFIRDRIMQGIVYPERARRMGWEGKVVLSFTVHENGSIDDVKIIDSSGFSVLDENARETIAKTDLKRKVPVRLVVLLPVEYRLR